MLIEKQITDQIRQLTGESLKKQIKEVIVRPQFLLFSTIIELPEFIKLQDKKQIDSLLSIYLKETYQSHMSKAKSLLNLNPLQILKLKQLTILTLFEGLHNYSLTKLAAQLSIDTLKCIQILLDMNINKLIQVKIDEQINNIDIYFAKRRQIIPTTNEGEATRIITIEGRISKIIKSNNNLEYQIKTALEGNGKQKSKQFKKQLDFERRFELH